MNLITRFCTVKYWLPLICLVNVFSITAYADVDSGETWYPMPFKDQKETQLFFSIQSEQECKVDKEGQCWVSLKELKPFTFIPQTKEGTAKLIEDHKMIPLKKEFIDAESHEGVEVEFLCKLVVWNGNNLYVNRECEFKAPLFKPTRITADDDKSKTLTMERKTQYYLTLKLPSELEQWDHLEKDLKGTAQMASGVETICLKYSKERGYHNFTIEKEEDFKLRIEDPFLKCDEIPKDIWEDREPGKSKHGEYAINKLCKFNLKVQLTGDKARKIDSAKLVSIKTHGVPSKADKFKEAHGAHTAQFINLRYEDLPFQVTAAEQGYFLKHLDISINDYEDMNPSDPPLLERKWVVWEYVERLEILVTDLADNPMSDMDMIVVLEDSQNFLKEKIKDLPGRTEKYPDNGEVFFSKVYDWRHSQIEIKDSKEQTIFGPTEVNSPKIEIKGGNSSNSINVIIKIGNNTEGASSQSAN